VVITDPENTAVGDQALANNTGQANTATGFQSLFSNTTGSDNTANGAFALFTNTEGIENTATGESALASNSTGNANTATGFNALLSNTIGTSNTANGGFALSSNTTGNSNTATGAAALQFSTGDGNTANGALALFSNTTGTSNTAVGSGALVNSTIGVDNTALGVAAGSAVTNASNVICIGFGVAGANVSNSCFIGNIRGVTTHIADAVPVVIDSTGQVGTQSSSRRFKKEIKPMDHASEAILALKPVTFHYKSDAQGTPQFGLIAEEVAAVDPDLVVRDQNGEIYTVRYDAVNAMLLNEFLKEHKAFLEEQRKAQEQAATVARLEKEIQTVVAHAKEQDSKIQRVSDQVQMTNANGQAIVSSR